MMDWFNHLYPYTNAHELNLDWIIDTIKKLVKEMEEFTGYNQITFAEPIDWNATTYYKRFTIVLYTDGCSYISKEDVPVGVPPEDSNYWAKIADFNAQIALLEQGLDFTTPEQHGAIGDGVADDTAAVQVAIDSGKICLIKGTYKVTDTLSVPSNTNIIMDGIIHYTGQEAAIEFTNQFVKVSGVGRIISDGKYCVKINTNYISIDKVRLTCNTLNCIACVYMYSDDDDKLVMKNTINDLALQGLGAATPHGIGIYLHTTNNGWVNENVFRDINIVGFVDAVKIRVDSTNGMNRNKFEGIDTEVSTYALDIASSTNKPIRDCVFDFRTEELQDGDIKIDKNVIWNTFKIPFVRPTLFAINNPEPNTLNKTIGYTDANFITGVFGSAGGTIMGYNPVFIVLGSRVLFNMSGVRRPNIYVSGTFVLSYSDWAFMPYANLHVRANQSNVTIDLNYLSDWAYSPLNEIVITNTSGTDLTIVNDQTVLFAATHLDEGTYRAHYNSTHDAISLEKVTFV